MLQRVHLRDVEGVPARRVGCTCEMWRVYPRDVEGAPARREAWKVNNFRRKSTFSGKESTSPVKVVNCSQTRQST